MHQADPRQLSENGLTFKRRVDAGLQRLLSRYADQDRILVVTHGTFIRSLVLRFGPQFDVLSSFPANGGVTTLQLTTANPGFDGLVTSYNRLS